MKKNVLKWTLFLAAGSAVACALILGAAALGKGLVFAQAPVTKAIAVLTPTPASESHVKGIVTFTLSRGGVEVEGHISGLKANSKHGFHIHEFGDISAPDGMSTGGHFNPGGHNHAGPNDPVRHAGDLGNLEADASGHAHYKRLDATLKLEGPDSIIGRGLVVHAAEDDLTTQPTGNAGARIAVAVIGVAKGE